MLALALVAFFAVPYLALDRRFPVGPDAPVYLWWARAAGAEGLSVVGLRPGAPGLAAALGVVLAAAAGLACVALFAPYGWASALLGGALGGAFAAHLAGGYTANLAAAALVLGAMALLGHGPGRREALAAGGLLAAAALSHPLFAAVGAVILAGAVALGAARDRTAMGAEARTVATALAVGAAGAGAGFLALGLTGASVIEADTSKDAFLRRAGLDDALRGEYLRRLARLWARFVLPVAVPLAAVGLWGRRREGHFVVRLLVSWAAVTAIGVAASVVTGVAPGVRFLAFAWVLPLGSALALPTLRTHLSTRGWRPVLATALAGILAAAVLAGSAYTWWRQNPFVHEDEAAQLEVVAGVAEVLPPGTPLVFLVDDDDPELVFLATLAGNIARAAVPPERVRDVHLYIGTPENYLAGRPTLAGDERYDAMSRLYLEDLRTAGGDPVAFVLDVFNGPGMASARQLGNEIDPGVVVLGADVPGTFTGPRPGAEPEDPLRPFSPWAVGPLALALLAVVNVAGFGWGRVLIGPGSAALAPAFGVAGITLSAILLDRLGLRLAQTWVAVLACALPAAGGYLAWFGRQRRSRA